MDIKAIYQEIEINKVNLNDQTFLLTPAEEVLGMADTVIKSISRTPMLTPPILQNDGEMYRIITGHEIFRHFTDKPVSKHLSCLIAEDGSDNLELLALALENISITRKPSPVEEAACLDKAIRFAGREKAISFFTPLLSLSRRFDPDTLLRLLEFDDTKLRAIHNGRLEISTAFSILEMNAADRDELFHFIIELKLSSSNQRKFLRNCSELTKRRSCSFKNLLNDSSILMIMQDRAIDNPKKTSRIMNWLNKQIFPKLSGAEDDFKKFIAQLDLPKNSEISHSPSFEKDSITFSTTFPGRRAFMDKLPKLKEIIEQ